MKNRNTNDLVAEELVKNNKLAEAELLYRQLCARNPDDTKLLIRLSLVCWYQGKTQTAEQILVKLIRKDPDNIDALNNLGVMRHLEHSFEAAISLFSRVLEIDPGYENANFNLGNVYAEMGELEKSLNSYLREISIQPNGFTVYISMADVLYRLGESKKALDAYDTALRIKPDLPEVYRNKGNILRATGSTNEAIDLFREAIRCKADYTEARLDIVITLMSCDPEQAIVECEKILQYKPQDTVAKMLLGRCLFLAKRISAASRIFEQILTADPNNEEACVNLSACYIEESKLDEAYKELRQCLNRNPINSTILYNIGRIFQLNENYSEAASFFITALRFRDDYSDAINNLGICYIELERFPDAIAVLERLCHIRPGWPDGRLNLANAFEKSGYLEQAMAQLVNALELDETNVDALHNLGHIYHLQGKLAQATFSYRKVLGLDSQYHLSRYNLSHIYLLRGLYRRGLIYYESRFKIKKPIRPIAEPKCKRWGGSLSPKDNTLLIVAEQGLGDFMQFARYISYLGNLGIQTKVCCAKELHSLLIDSEIDNCPLTPEEGCRVTKGEWIPLLSIPLLLGVRPDRPLVQGKYLYASKNKMKEWETRLANMTRPIVAINWQGNPEAELGLLRGRSMPLSLFERIAVNIHCTLISIQKGSAAKQLDRCSFKNKFVPFQPEITSLTDLSDTAAIVQNCDLVITTDTSMAHLAGGLGTTVWLLLSKSHDWRWGQEVSSTFWYPHMRIFRQDNRGKWAPVLDRVEKELGEFVQSRHK